MSLKINKFSHLIFSNLLYYYNKKRSEPREVKIHPPLDYQKIKHGLLNKPEKRQISLLQALRWRLTKAESIEQRHRILTCYIAGDLLNCRSEKQNSNPIIELLKSPNYTIKEFMARLINTFASLNQGYYISHILVIHNQL